MTEKEKRRKRLEQGTVVKKYQDAENEIRDNKMLKAKWGSKSK